MPRRAIRGALPRRLSAEREVVALVGVELGRSEAWPSRLANAAADRRDGVDQRLQELTVVHIGR
jgi:hypothetical protein